MDAAISTGYTMEVWNCPPPFQSHINLDFEREVCGVARELTLKHLKLINSSK